MKRYTQLIFILTILLAGGTLAFYYFGLAVDPSSGQDAPIRYRAYYAEPQSETAGTTVQSIKSERLSSAIAIEANETLLDLYASNLDMDDEEEQILVIRRTDDPSGRIRIVVADYSPITRRWVRLWEDQTEATKIKTFQVTVGDILGDYSLAIICSGINDANEQTMSVFWRTFIDKSQRMQFSPIITVAGDTVTLNTTVRPDSYKLGLATAPSWTISAWRADPAAANPMNQVKEVWNWDPASQRYQIISTEHIPGASIARRLAEAILDGQTATFENFIEGIWYKESTDPLSEQALFLTFQPKDGAILFSAHGIVEIYEWENSNTTRYGLYVACRNQSVRNLRRLMDIELVSSDTINVRVFQDLRIKADIADRWDGRYRQLGAEMAKAFRREPAEARMMPDSIDGEYQSGDGVRLSFSGTSYTWIDQDLTEIGYYTIFNLDASRILDMRRFQAAPDSLADRKSWILTLSGKDDAPGKPIRILTLQPVRIGLKGIEKLDGPLLTLEQRRPDD
jgi:hypothetical protein